MNKKQRIALDMCSRYGMDVYKHANLHKVAHMLLVNSVASLSFNDIIDIISKRDNYCSYDSEVESMDLLIQIFIDLTKDIGSF